MYEIEDLFDKRSIVGSKLEELIGQRNITKAELSKKSGVSRPTIDKVLDGSLTSKTNFEKHISKILGYLNITPDIIMGNVINVNSRAKKIRDIMMLSCEEVSKASGISLDRLRKIELGEDASLAELRDVALCLSTSVRSILGTNFFEPQISTLEDCICFRDHGNIEELGGFWGHVGVILKNTDKYLWYPITGSTRKMIYESMENEEMVIPCMNNKVLLLVMSNVKEIVLLDDACDQPSYINWNNKVSEGEIPGVVYEALEDYIYDLEMGDNENNMSPKFKKQMESIIKEKRWTEDNIEEITIVTNIYFADGHVRPIDIAYNMGESISTEVYNVYLFGEDIGTSKILYLEDTNGAESILNMKNVSMIEMPLINLEDAIIAKSEEDGW